ncbi:hypothetical protein FH972_023575 [Carpinus fangiana]|uniref:C4-dicarboxylate transporter/malic acid transport protein n=1 Tax=Carpinus fangiana TaxID=176857 RepID=A0A5N6KVK5_9ROSI|nr:hypothetical protein FH972_023575 [Carpinus fangiana]
MGTGIVSVLLYFIPFHARWTYYLSIIFFVLNIAIFSLALLTTILRYALYPEIWSVMIDDPRASLFLGTIPMAFATIIEMVVFICVPVWGEWCITFAWALWMIDAVASAGVTISLVFILISSENTTQLSAITAVQLLPIAATIVAAGTGAEVAEVLPNPNHALGTIMTSYVLWGMAMPLAMTVLVIYFHRLAVHKLPPRELIVSCFLPLGPLGFGGYTIMYLGMVARKVLPQTGTLPPNSELAGEVLYVLGFIVALVLWGFGLMWLAIAVAAIYRSRPFPFNMGWWGFTFPLGVYSASTIQIGLEMPSLFFKVLGTIFSVCVVLLWVVVALGTVRGAKSGELFNAPCLANLPVELVDKGKVEKSSGKAA